MPHPPRQCIVAAVVVVVHAGNELLLPHWGHTQRRLHPLPFSLVLPLSPVVLAQRAHGSYSRLPAKGCMLGPVCMCVWVRLHCGG